MGGILTIQIPYPSDLAGLLNPASCAGLGAMHTGYAQLLCNKGIAQSRGRVQRYTRRPELLTPGHALSHPCTGLCDVGCDGW